MAPVTRKPKPCYIVNKITGEIVSEHESIKNAAKKMGIHPSCCKQVRRKALLAGSKYVIRLVDDYDPHESFAGKRAGVPVVVSRDNEVHVFWNRDDVAEFLHITRITVAKRIASGTPTNEGWRIRKLPYMGALNEVLGIGRMPKSGWKVTS